MKVKAIKEFYDLERKEAVKVGDVWEVTAARGKALTTAHNGAGYVLCEDITPAVADEEAAPIKKTQSRKKKEA